MRSQVASVDAGSATQRERSLQASEEGEPRGRGREQAGRGEATSKEGRQASNSEQRFWREREKEHSRPLAANTGMREAEGNQTKQQQGKINGNCGGGGGLYGCSLLAG